MHFGPSETWHFSGVGNEESDVQGFKLESVCTDVGCPQCAFLILEPKRKIRSSNFCGCSCLRAQEGMSKQQHLIPAVSLGV